MRQAHAQTEAVAEIAKSGASELFEYGLLGVFVVVLALLNIYIQIMHRAERKETREDNKLLHERYEKDAEKREARFAETIDKNSQSSDKLADSIAALSRDIWRKPPDN